MRVLLFFFAALTAAVAVQAQTPPPAAPPAARAAARRRRRRRSRRLPRPALRLRPARPRPRALPPAGSGPVVYQVVPCFEKQGGFPVVEANTYLYYIQLTAIGDAQADWVPYDESTEQVIREDFKRLWATNFLDDLAIRVEDYAFSNGVIGKLVVYDMEERQRVKIVDYEGLKKVDQSKIEEELKEKSITIRLDSFIDPGLIRRVTGVVRELYAAEGYQFAEVRPEIKDVEGGTKLVHVTFHVTEGPKVKISDVDFVGNKAIADGKLARKMKENKEKGFFGFITGGGTYKEDKFAEDAQLITDFYRDEGYIMAQVGQPQMKTLEDSKDGKTRWVQLQVPITEGKQYAVGDFKFEGNKVVNSEALRPLFKVEGGEDLQPEEESRRASRRRRRSTAPAATSSSPPIPICSRATMPTEGARRRDWSAVARPPSPAATCRRGAIAAKDGTPLVDVTMRVDEGKQYFVNRITFTGNTTTRDNVIRREMRLVEAGVFNTQALKDSVKRLNQLGYFKPLEGEAVDVAEDAERRQQGRHRAQVRGAEPQPADVRRRRLAVRRLLRAAVVPDVELPRPRRDVQRHGAAGEPRQELSGRVHRAVPVRPADDGRRRHLRPRDPLRGSVHAGVARRQPRLRLPGDAVRADVRELQPRAGRGQGPQPALPGSARARRQSVPGGLAAHRRGRQADRSARSVRASSTTPSITRSSRPPERATRCRWIGRASAATRTSSIRGRKAIWYLPHRRQAPHVARASARRASTSSRTAAPSRCPIFERLFLGGEYSMRGFDLRTVGPRDPATGLVLGGNKSLLFNVEYLISIAGPVRLVLFYDAGQVRDPGENFSWKEPMTNITYPGALIPDPSDFYQIPCQPVRRRRSRPRSAQLGEMSAFKTSTGAEIRFFMPVLNVPFRLIFAANPSRGGVLDNNLQPEKKWKFRFAVGRRSRELSAASANGCSSLRLEARGTVESEIALE